MHNKTIHKEPILGGRELLNLAPPKTFNYIQNNVLDSNRDRLAMASFVGDRYWGLGEDAVASLHAATMVEREEQIEEANLSGQIIGYRDAGKKYKRYKALGKLGRGCHAIATKYEIPLVWLCRFNKGE